MAATAVYANLMLLPTDRASQSVKFSNIAATPADFDWPGGLSQLAVKASTFGTVTLQYRLPDDTTFVTALTAISADGVSAPTNLPPGRYRLAIA